MTRNYYSVGFDNGFAAGFVAGLLIGIGGTGLAYAAWVLLF